MYTILIFVHEIQMNAKSEKNVSICSDSLAALIALQAAKTSPLVRQCQKALNNISTWYSVGLFWVPEHSGLGGTEISDELAREGSFHQFVGPEPPWGVSRQNTEKKIKC
jgi:ribonuclease HI